MDGYFYARLAYEAFFANVKRIGTFDDMSLDHKENWKRAAAAVLAGGAPTIEQRATTVTLPPVTTDMLEQMEQRLVSLIEDDPDSSPTPIEVPHPQHGSGE